MVDLETVRGLMSAPDRSYPGNETHPIGEENEDENSCKDPERPVDQVRANDSFQKTVEALNEPFKKVLCSFGNFLHLPRSHLSKNDESQRHNPSDDHGIRDRETEGAGELDGLL